MQLTYAYALYLLELSLNAMILGPEKTWNRNSSVIPQAKEMLNEVKRNGSEICLYNGDKITLKAKRFYLKTYR